MNGDRRDVELVFTHAALFANLSARQQRRLAHSATRRVYPSGATIIREGDTSMALYVVLAGRVVVEMRANGKTHQIREIGPNGFFGELGLIDDRPRSASVVAVEPTQCALLSIADIRRNAGLALGLLPAMAQRIRDTTRLPAVDDTSWLAGLED
jgi:CRP-like cAMP-binding protein